mgnify:CR=1 FL=1|jgi:hypothetical protein
MEQINLDALSTEIVNTDYYKRLQKSLRKKHLKNIESKKETSIKQSSNKLSEIAKTKTQKNEKPTLDDLHFKDEVILSKKETSPSKKDIYLKKTNSEHLQKEQDKIKYNAKDILRSLGYKIDFHAKKEELKEMYKFNIQESKSHNIFASRFASFKVGIVNQLLSAIGVPVEELNKLKKECQAELINQNCTEMAENVYNIELNEIINGRGKKSRHYTTMFINIQRQLMTQMNNVGKTGFWSKQKIYEEKINQCEKIKQEFKEEMQHLEYLLGYIKQKKARK